ncbi:MAG: hypothetical protein K9G49_15570 [Taibaiella sp.]|nr:hypothetical protein [Taibaiella sp.]
MPCPHKFSSYLQLDRLDFVPETLIVGTFNPAWPGINTSEWFYGNTDDNYFWDIMPRMYGEESLIAATPDTWKQFCHDKRIAFTDLISAIDDADESNLKHHSMLGGFSDKSIIHNFEDFEYENIVQLLRQYPTIKQVYLTRGVTEAFWRHLWGPVMHYCNHNNVRERKLLTPSGDAAYHQEAHNKDNPTDVILRLEDYVLRRWQQEWHL